MSTSQHFSTHLPPVSLSISVCCGKDMYKRRTYNLHNKYDKVSKSIPKLTYGDWQKSAINAMSLDDDYYYIEYEANSHPEAGENVHEVEMETDPHEADEDVGESEMELDEVDKDVEDIQNRLERVHINTEISQPTMFSSIRPVSLIKMLGASHIANNTTLDVIMEEDEDDFTYTPMYSADTNKNTNGDIFMEDGLVMVQKIESTHIQTVEVVMEFHSLDTDMDPQRMSTTPTTPRLSRVQQFQQFTSLVRTFLEMSRSVQVALETGHYTPFPGSDPLRMATFSFGSSFDSNHDDIITNEFSASSAIKRNRDADDDGEVERYGIMLMGVGAGKRARLMRST